MSKNAKQAAKTATINMEQLAGLQNAILAQDAEAIRAELAKFTAEDIANNGMLGFYVATGNNIIANAERLAMLESKNAELAANQKRPAKVKVEKTEMEKMVSSGARRAAIAVIIAPSKTAQEQQCILNAITLLSNETSYNETTKQVTGLKSGAQRQLVLHAGNALEFAKEVMQVTDLPQGIQDAVGDIERIAKALWDRQLGLDDKGEQIADLVASREDKSATSILVALGFEVEAEMTPESLMKLKA